MNRRAFLQVSAALPLVAAMPAVALPATEPIAMAADTQATCHDIGLHYIGPWRLPPAVPRPNDVWYDTTHDRTVIYNGAEWVVLCVKMVML